MARGAFLLALASLAGAAFISRLWQPRSTSSSAAALNFAREFRLEK